MSLYTKRRYRVDDKGRLRKQFKGDQPGWFKLKEDALKDWEKRHAESEKQIQAENKERAEAKKKADAAAKKAAAAAKREAAKAEAES